MSREDQYNPEIEQQLNTLSRLCCEALAGEEEPLKQRGELVLKALLLSGFTRTGGSPLQAELERRIRDECREPAMHRGGQISGITKKLQRRLDDLARWESKSPTKEGPPHAANVSSAAQATSRRPQSNQE